MAIAKKKLAEPVRIEIKKEDTVKVISGRDKGKTGRVLRVDRDTGKVLAARNDDQASYPAESPEADQRRHRGAREPHRSLECTDCLSRLQ